MARRRGTEERGAGRSSRATPDRIIAVGLLAAAVVFILQNRQEATFQLLALRISAPLWFASTIQVAIGVVAGVLLTRRR